MNLGAWAGDPPGPQILGFLPSAGWRGRAEELVASPAGLRCHQPHPSSRGCSSSSWRPGGWWGVQRTPKPSAAEQLHDPSTGTKPPGLGSGSPGPAVAPAPPGRAAGPGGTAWLWDRPSTLGCCRAGRGGARRRRSPSGRARTRTLPARTGGSAGAAPRQEPTAGREQGEPQRRWPLPLPPAPHAPGDPTRSTVPPPDEPRGSAPADPTEESHSAWPPRDPTDGRTDTDRSPHSWPCLPRGFIHWRGADGGHRPQLPQQWGREAGWGVGRGLQPPGGGQDPDLEGTAGTLGTGVTTGQP